MISGPAPLVTYLQKTDELYDVFSKKQYSLEEGLKVLESVICYFKNVLRKLEIHLSFKASYRSDTELCAPIYHCP